MKGIPQGSILAPPVVKHFRNDLHKVTENTAILTYADDTQDSMPETISKLDRLLILISKE